MGGASEVGLALDEVRVPMLSVRFVQNREEKESKGFPVGRVELWLQVKLGMALEQGVGRQSGGGKNMDCLREECMAQKRMVGSLCCLSIEYVKTMR